MLSQIKLSCLPGLLTLDLSLVICLYVRDRLISLQVALIGFFDLECRRPLTFFGFALGYDIVLSLIVLSNQILQGQLLLGFHDLKAERDSEVSAVTLLILVEFIINATQTQARFTARTYLQTKRYTGMKGGKGILMFDTVFVTLLHSVTICTKRKSNVLYPSKQARTNLHLSLRRLLIDIRLVDRINEALVRTCVLLELLRYSVIDLFSKLAFAVAEKI